MIRKTALNIHTVSGLRTRYLPRSRVNEGLISLAPWVNVALLVGFYLFIATRFVLVPGAVVELPAGPFQSGLRPELTAVVLAAPSGQPGAPREEIVFFDDSRYLVRDADQMARLQRAIGAQPERRRRAGLVIAADAAVRHGTLVELFNMARAEGIVEVNLATRPPAETRAAGSPGATP
jgi:biopolymer transport protein ExbD